MFAVAIIMPSGCESREHEFSNLEDAAKLSANYAIQMRAWKDFEAEVVIREYQPHERVKVLDVKSIKT